MELPDIVIPVRSGESNEELRFALRSFCANLPHRQVVIAGYKPSWLRGVLHVPVRQQGTKYANSTANVTAACRHPAVGERFLLCNDDFFVLQPVTGPMPVYHRGPVVEVEEYYAGRAGRYVDGMRATRLLLEQLGHPDPLSYELHVPMPMTKTGFLEALEHGRHLPVLHKRTLYGNLQRLGGSRLRDPKVTTTTRAFTRGGQFISTMDTSWHGHVGGYVRSLFPSPCGYEGRLTHRQRAGAVL